MIRLSARRLIGVAFVIGSLAAGSSGAALASGTSAAGAVHPAITPVLRWGWVNVVSTAEGSYLASAANHGNSQGKDVRVDHGSTGLYVITMKGLGSDGGNVQVTVLGGATKFCGATNWSRDGGAELIYVNCFDKDGNHVDTKFMAQYLSTNYASKRLGYLWADAPSATDYDLNDDIDGPYSFNNAGGPNHIHRSSEGRYVVTLPGLGVAHGNVQVTSYFPGVDTAGTRPAGSFIGDCGVMDWGPEGSDLIIEVACNNALGDPLDLMFTLIFTEKQGLKGPGGGPAAYLYANNADVASYTPAKAYRWSSSGMAATVQRLALGRYKVTLPGFAPGGTFAVTPRSADPGHCIVVNRGSTASAVTAKIKCYAAMGVPADSEFTLSYEK